MGIPVFLKRTPSPDVWSVCSWVTKTASISDILTPIKFNNELVFVKLKPQSIKMLELPSVT